MSFLSESAVWSLSDAKARLSELVENASSVPQVIARHGNPSVVVLSMERYKLLAGGGESVVDFFRNSPLFGLDLDLERSKEMPRDIDL